MELKPDFKGLEASEIFRILQKSNEEENVIAKVVEDLPPPRGPRTRAAIYEPTNQKGVVDVEISPLITVGRAKMLKKVQFREAVPHYLC